MKVYIAAASSDLDNAEVWMTALEREGIEVTSTWIPTVRNVGLANPRDVSNDKRNAWASKDLWGVEEADAVWFLVHPDAPARGAYYEAGYADALGIPVLFSGDTKQSIFCARGKEYPTHMEAFDALLDMNDRHDALRARYDWEAM